MKDIILVGSGGCMREIAWQMQEQNKKKHLWNILGYVDCEEPENSKGVFVGKQMISYLGTDDVLLQKKEAVNVAICVGAPTLRKKIAEKLEKNPWIQFPVILLEANVCEDIKMGRGCIVSMDTRISTNVTIGEFSFLNIGSKVCHDGKIGSFVTLSPDVSLAGNVEVGAESDIGMGTKVIQGIQIGENTIVGAGSVVVRSVEGHCTVAGVPARRIKG